jgi:phthiocerol/phenolphthiocerol synthesis type-I polyketide synthase D
MDRFRAFEEHIYQTYQTRLEIPYDALSSMSNSEQLATFLEILSSSGLDMPPAIVTHQYTSYADTRLAEMYVPQGKYEGLSLLYHASPDPVAAKLDPRYGRNDETLGWDELCSDLQIVYVPGDHISVIDRPNVDVLAQHLNDFLAALAVSAAGNPAASSS